MAQRDARPRRSDRRGGRKRVPVLVVVLVTMVIVGVAAIALGLQAAGRTVDDAQPLREAGESVSPSVATSAVADAGTVEVPDVTSMTQADAAVLLSAAGLKVDIRSSEASPTGGPATALIVSGQDPRSGTLVQADTTVVLTLVPAVEPKVVSSRPKKVADAPRWVVCIDPGHQSKGDSSPEPVGPGSTETKPRVTGGATGALTEIPEYEVVLQISMNLKTRLEKRGIKVVMTRTTSDVNLSNSERAAIANKAKADLFVRVHCDGSPDEDTSGLSTLYPGSNRWTRPIASDSRDAAGIVHHAVLRATGAVDRGRRARTDLSGFNWSKVPSVLVECGFLSNPVEDRLLSSPHYQDKLAAGMTEGIVTYLERSER